MEKNNIRRFKHLKRRILKNTKGMDGLRLRYDYLQDFFDR
jgi:hypothetical protein